MPDAQGITPPSVHAELSRLQGLYTIKTHIFNLFQKNKKKKEKQHIHIVSWNSLKYVHLFLLVAFPDLPMLVEFLNRLISSIIVKFSQNSQFRHAHKAKLSHLHV